MLVAGLQVALERGRELVPLRISGAPTAVLSRSQALVVALPRVMGATLAATVGILASVAWNTVQRAAEFHAGTIVAMYLATVLVSVLIALATTVGIETHAATSIRRE